MRSRRAAHNVLNCDDGGVVPPQHVEEHRPSTVPANVGKTLSGTSWKNNRSIAKISVEQTLRNKLAKFHHQQQQQQQSSTNSQQSFALSVGSSSVRLHKRQTPTPNLHQRPQQRLYVAPPSSATFGEDAEQEEREEEEEEFPPPPNGQTTDGTDSDDGVANARAATTTTLADQIRQLREQRQRRGCGSGVQRPSFRDDDRQNKRPSVEEAEDQSWSCDHFADARRPATSDASALLSTNANNENHQRRSSASGRARHLSEMFTERDEHRVQVDDAWRRREAMAKKLAQAQERLRETEEKHRAQVKLRDVQQEETRRRAEIVERWLTVFEATVSRGAMRAWRDECVRLVHQQQQQQHRHSDSCGDVNSDATTQRYPVIKDSDLLRALRKAETRVMELEKERDLQQPKQQRVGAKVTSMSNFRKPGGTVGGARNYLQTTNALLNTLYGNSKDVVDGN